MNILWHPIKRKIAVYINVYTGRTPPVVVYQMAKVGSLSVVKSIIEYGLSPVYHVHRMAPDNIQKTRQQQASKIKKKVLPGNEVIGEALYGSVIRGGKKAKFITLVREPIGRNVSAFFHNLSQFTVGSDMPTIDELRSIFLTDYPHRVPLDWFDVEIKETLKIDVYDHAFPQERGYMTLRNGKFELLILKSEIEDAVKEREIATFLNLPGFRLQRSNIGINKSYGDIYREFVQKIQLPVSYIETMCSAKYTKHFYNNEEIERIRACWQRTEVI